MTGYGVVLLSLAGVALAWLWIAFLIGLVVAVLDARAARRSHTLPVPVRPGSFSQGGG